MTFRIPATLRPALLTCCLAALVPAAQADETAGTSAPSSTTRSITASTATTTNPTVGTSTATEAKLSAEFASLLGGQDGAAAVVSGLRQGTAFSLDGTTTSSGTDSTSTSATSATIDPPTGPMGYGNVRITLRLAQAELNALGVTQPTSEQLSAVLVGGEINGTQIDGILTLRADGMGWGQIAQQYGMTVGQLMGKGAAVAKMPATTTTRQTHTTVRAGQPSQARANGYIPDSPKPASPSHARSNGYIPSGSKAGGLGMVSAAGGSLGDAAQGGGKGQGHKITSSAQGAGMVSAGGQQISMASGGKAQAPGQARKN